MGEKNKHKVWKYSTRYAEQGGKLIQLWTRAFQVHFRLILTYSEGVYEWYLLPADLKVGDESLTGGSVLAANVAAAQDHATRRAEEFLNVEKTYALFTGLPDPERLPIMTNRRRREEGP